MKISDSASELLVELSYGSLRCVIHINAGRDTGESVYNSGSIGHEKSGRIFYIQPNRRIPKPPLDGEGAPAIRARRPTIITQDTPLQDIRLLRTWLVKPYTSLDPPPPPRCR